MSAPDVLATIGNGWNCAPGGTAVGTGRSGVCAAIWGCKGDVTREVSGTLSDTHVVAVQLKPIRGNTFIDGRLRFTEPAPRGAVNVVRAGEVPRVVIEGPYSMLHMYLPAALLSGFLVEEELPDPTRVELVCPNLAQDRVIARIAGEILSEMQQRRPLNRLRVDVLGQDLAVHLLRRWSNLAGTRVLAGEPVRGGLAAWQQRRATEYLSERLAENVGLSDLAGKAGLSAFHFARMFKQSTGLSPHAYLRRLRCERAGELLETTKLSIGEVARAVGYETPQAFARTFRAETGMSPSEFRRARSF